METSLGTFAVTRKIDNDLFVKRADSTKWESKMFPDKQSRKERNGIRRP
jgi:hypothetical protein